MDTRQYIDSGILEAYLLGLVSEDEQQEVEVMMEAYPEISTALNNLEIIIEEQCLANAVPPPPGTWEAIQARTTGKEIKKRTQPAGNGKSAPPEPEKPDYLEVEVNNTHIQVHKIWRPIFVVVFFLSKVFLALALYYYFKSDSQNQEIERLKTEIKENRVK
ncbi:hypothetical protein [Tellurirhabdus bombi]|uniref:hypothetical protein n=1 Tax=Tellurirhabdus bombi TaxID=2907205 RepID=UPI001F37C674|nr:hypothetical protein [Tellurirhabdus bombi]